jgi:DNA polymerase III subunit delta'
MPSPPLVCVDPKGPMPLSLVHHQEPAVAALTQALATGHLAHAWLFSGPEGVGRELTALKLAQALICPLQPRIGCGACPACRRVEKRNHPDVTWVFSEDEQVSRGLAGRGDFQATPSKDIRIEQVRRLQDRLALKPLEGPSKVAILVGAHALNLNAQNALLKTLEEPPSDTVLVLISSTPDKLLPTIRSRCAHAAFRPLPAAFVEAHLLEHVKGLSPQAARTAARMADGSLERALALDVDTLEQRRELIERFEALDPRDARGWLALAETLAADRKSAEGALALLEVWLRDVAVAQVGGADLANLDLQALAVAAAAKVSPAGLMRRAVLLEEAKNAISQRNGMARLQLERMLIEMLAA